MGTVASLRLANLHCRRATRDRSGRNWSRRSGFQTCNALSKGHDDQQGDSQIMLVMGQGHCPWGEAGTDIMSQGLGFQTPATWRQAAQHLCKKLRQAVPGLGVHIVDLGEAADHAPRATLCACVNVPRTTCDRLAQSCRNILILSPAAGDSVDSSAARLVPRQQTGRSAAEVLQQCEELWSRQTSEDCLYALLFAVHFAVMPVEFVAQEPQIDTVEKVFTLCTKCLSEAVAAGLDSEARACLACQNGCDVRDQTQMYRCTVSHESESLASLVRCFERRSIFNCDARIPDLHFDPLAEFRGNQLSLEAAWKIMEGHWSLDPSSCSWRPVLGQNPAYDYFPCQFNSWYRDPCGSRGWYDPVFKVVTLDGREVWRKRHYRVLPGDVPGSFRLTTEDNGISLREYWRIVDADDDLGWAVLHYAGAAPRVGQSYTGSLLVSRDGCLPDAIPSQRIAAAFRRAGVAKFELYAIHQGEACLAGGDWEAATDRVP